jgi:hypothetical protein
VYPFAKFLKEHYNIKWCNEILYKIFLLILIRLIIIYLGGMGYFVSVFFTYIIDINNISLFPVFNTINKNVIEINPNNINNIINKFNNIYNYIIENI